MAQVAHQGRSLDLDIRVLMRQQLSDGAHCWLPAGIAAAVDSLEHLWQCRRVTQQ